MNVARYLHLNCTILKAGRVSATWQQRAHFLVRKKKGPMLR